MAATASQTMNRRLPGFGSTTKRKDMSFSSTAPGPGSYNAQQSEGGHNTEKQQSSAFASKSTRGNLLVSQERLSLKVLQALVEFRRRADVCLR